jgi:hypothetical protein
MLDTLRRLICACLLAAIIALPISACSHAVTVTAASGLDDSIASLAGGGVAVMEDFAATTPIVALTGAPSAMRFTRWQLQNLVAEANGHAGYLGSELDTLAAPPAGAAPLSLLLGAWLTRNDGALAHYAHVFMGDQDYKTSASIVFPTIVVLSFIADIARVTTTSLRQLHIIALERLVATPAEADGICTLIAGWVSGVVNSVTSAVQANGAGWLASLWNTVVNLAGTAITIIVNGITQTLAGFITKIAAICGTLMQIAALFKPWSVALIASPASITLGNQPVPGAFDATLNAKDIPWPPDLVGCVAAISSNHIDLTDASYKNAPVTWTKVQGIPGLATEQSEDATLLDDKTAHYKYLTIKADEPAPDACPVLVPAGKLAATVTVERSDITKTLTSLETLITSQLNSSIQSYLQPYISPAVDAVTSTANKFAAPHETAVTTIKENIADPLCPHTPPPNTSTTPAAKPSIAGSAYLPWAPCSGIISSVDTAPYYGGATPITLGDQQQDFETIMKAFGKMADASASDYDATATSTCFIGMGKGNDMQIVAEFATVPRKTPYTNPDIHTTDEADPTSCRAAIGYDLLDHFHADCFSHANMGIQVEGPAVKYVLLNVGLGKFVPNGAEAAQVMKHLLQRYQ